jgi:RNA polymerase sigma-70 factor (ECF subfamily)
VNRGALSGISPHVDVSSASSDTEPTLGRRMLAQRQHVEAALAGDDAAFEALVLDRLPRTYRMALAILGSEADARDAVQEAWVSVWRQMPSLRDPARFDAWLDQILVNACRSGLRKRRRVREIPLDDNFDIEAPQPGPDHITEREALQRAFDGLSVEQRTLLVLHHLERRPLTAIAELFGIPVGTAKSRLHAARTALERTLEAER